MPTSTCRLAACAPVALAADYQPTLRDWNCRWCMLLKVQCPTMHPLLPANLVRRLLNLEDELLSLSPSIVGSRQTLRHKAIRFD